MELSVIEERYTEAEGGAYQQYVFKQGKREMRARRYDDEAERAAIVDERRWSARGWTAWSAFERVPYFDPFFCAVVRHLLVQPGVDQVELLLPVHAQRYQLVEPKKLQF